MDLTSKGGLLFKAPSVVVMSIVLGRFRVADGPLPVICWAVSLFGVVVVVVVVVAVEALVTVGGVVVVVV